MDIRKYTHLSILQNADDGCITYYTGDNPEKIIHLKNCLLICKPNLSIPKNLPIEILKVEDPQLEFYKISAFFKKDYLENECLVFREEYKSYIHKDCVIGQNVHISPGCVISKCIIGKNTKIHSNVTIYSNTTIGKNCIIEASTVIGATGVMWVWDGDDRKFLEQLGGVVIKDDVFIGSNITIVRGSANDNTIIGKGTCIAHGTMIGHGCKIGNYNHFANNVSLGGGVESDEACFFGSGCVVAPGKKLAKETIIAAGAVIVKDTVESGVYAGVPAVKLKDAEGKLSGIPKWKVKENNL